MDHEGSKAHVDSYTPGLYAGYADPQGFFANGLFTYPPNELRESRRIVFPRVDRHASGSTSGNQFGVQPGWRL